MDAKQQSEERQTYNDFAYPLYLHPEVIDEVKRHQPHLGKRLSLLLSHLAARGRTSVVKGCNDSSNRGWLRSPLGGNNGMHYYLWWTPNGSQVSRSIKLNGSQSIILRAVRHHDQHQPLDVGNISDYLQWRQEELEDDDMVPTPWTDEQRAFVDSRASIREIIGKPGAGKTSALWQSITKGPYQRILYLTWSPELSRNAELHFQSFATRNQQIDSLTCLQLINRICGEDHKRISLQQSRLLFRTALNQIHNNRLGKWRDHENALFSEVRSFLIGAALAHNENTISHENQLHYLNKETYVTLREKSIGREAASELWDIFNALINSNARLKLIFPEIYATQRGAQRLATGKILSNLNYDYDQVVVDEIQDLTLLESNLIFDYAKQIAKKRGTLPALTLAGDEGQTVRPTGFRWARLNELLGQKIGKPEQFFLDENLRSPQRIADVVERAGKLYSEIDKSERPAKQRHSDQEQSLEGKLIHLRLESAGEAIELIEHLEQNENLILLQADEQMPEWLPKELAPHLLTPALAKGLEYQSVVVIDPGKLLASILHDKSRNKESSRLNELERRNRIDQLRVAISRATETLVFVDVATSDEEDELSRQLLEAPAPYDSADLLAHFSDPDITPEERIYACTRDAREQLDENPSRAWRRAVQAVRLLGDRDLPDSVANADVRQLAIETLLSTAATLLLHADFASLPTLQREEVANVGSEFAGECEQHIVTAFQALEQYSLPNSHNSQSGSTLLKLIQTIAGHLGESEWLRSALRDDAESIRERIEKEISDHRYALAYGKYCESALELIGFSGDRAAESERLRLRAFETLLQAESYTDTEEVFHLLPQENPLLLGRLREKQERFAEAAGAYEKAARWSDAISCWRNSGNWQRAYEIARTSMPSYDTTHLKWLSELTTLLEQCPENLKGQLTREEMKILEERCRKIYNSKGKKIFARPPPKDNTEAAP